jgi:predicted nucleic acid-binding protein
MPVKVVDASALAAVLFGEPEGPALATRLKGCRLAAPALLPFEVASVCLKKVVRHPGKRDLLLAAFRMLGRLEVARTEVNLSEVVSLAESAGLTVYDASYLWLARRLRAELVTLDERLAGAARE